MGAIDTNYTFTATDVITSTKMNNILEQSTITPTAIFNETLSVTSGKLLVKAGGITSNELGSNSVTTNSIADLNVTTGKLADSSVTLSKMATDSVGSNQIVDASITAPMLDGLQSGAAPIFGVRAWVTFDMTRNAAGASSSSLTPRFIIGSGNVTSVTKTDTGEATILFATALPNANYAYSGSGRYDSGGTSPDGLIIYSELDGPKSTTQLSITMMTAAATLANFNEVTVIVVG